MVPRTFLTLALRVALAIVVLFSLAIGYQPSAAQQSSSLYYYYQGQQMPLSVSAQWIAVRFAASTQAQTQPNIFARVAALGDPASVRNIPNPVLTLLPLKAGAGAADALQAVSAVRAFGSGVEWANPVFGGTAPTALSILTDELIAQFPANFSRDQITGLLKPFGAEIVSAMLSNDNTYVLRVLPGAGQDALALANLLQERKIALHAEPNFLNVMPKLSAPRPHEGVVFPALTTNDTYFNQQWAFNNTGQFTGATVDADIDAPEAWDLTQGSSNVIIAAIDEGVEITHPDLAAKMVTGYDAPFGDNDPTPQSPDSHGTAVSGLLGAISRNNLGVAGVCINCRIMPIRIAYSDAQGYWVTYDSWIANSINYAWQNGAHVLSNSWGGGSPSTSITGAIDAALASGRGGKGSVVVFASGNNNGAISYPGSLSQVLTVGATNMCDGRKSPTYDACNFYEYWWGGNYGSGLDVSAPGVNNYTTDNIGGRGYNTTGDYEATFNGTSSSTPIVAGIMGLILSVNPNLSATQAQDIIRNNADDVNSATYPGFDMYLGYGRVNARRAVQGAIASATIPDTIGVFRQSNKMTYVRHFNSQGAPNNTFTFSHFATNDIIVYGDWNGDGLTSIGLFRPSNGNWYLRNENSSAAPIVYHFAFGASTDIPVVGDWDGNGTDTIGVFRPSTGQFLLRNSLNTGPANATIVYGTSTDKPIAGDWNCDNRATPGLYRSSNSFFYLTNSTTGTGATSYSYPFGTMGDIPIVGDWNDNCADSTGVFRPSNARFYLRTEVNNSATTSLTFGASTDKPVIGRWTFTFADEPPAAAAPSFTPKQ